MNKINILNIIFYHAIDDDIDDVIGSADNDDIGEQKYSNIIKTNNNSSANQKGNFAGSSNNFDNITNNFSNNQNTNNNQKQSNTNIWDFDFGATVNSNSNIDKNNQAKSNIEYSDFQFFDNNKNKANNSNASNL